MSKKSKIYLDFDDWFSNSEAHGCSSASRDWMEQIWNDLSPTIEASRDDYKNAYVQLSLEAAKNKCELTDALLKYIEEFKKEDQPNFWKWWAHNGT